MKDNEGQREKQGRKKPALLAQDDKQHRGENMQKYANLKMNCPPKSKKI